MKKLAFTTAIALALATAAYAQDHHGGGMGRGPGPGGGGGPSLSAPAGSGGPSSNLSAPRGPSGPATSMGPNRGPGTLYNRAPTNMNSYKSGGSNFDKGRDRPLYNRADRDHDFDRDRHGEGGRDVEHRGIVRGDFFEHGRHFHFRRFWLGEWVFLTGWDDCTAWAWVNIAPGTWAWSPVDICVG
jgi:hypothetical protein